MLLGTLISGRNGQTRLGRWWPGVRPGLTLLALAMIALSSGPANASAGSDNRLQVSGAGRTIIEGGTGGASAVPVMTVLAFHASSQGGAFECLALAPAAATGDGSGRFGSPSPIFGENSHDDLGIAIRREADKPRIISVLFAL